MKKVIHVIISILYIVWGIWAPVSVLDALLAFNLPAMISAAVGVIMLLAGIFGLFRLKPAYRRVFGIIIFVGALVSVITSLLHADIYWSAVVQAILAWLYIVL